MRPVTDTLAIVLALAATLTTSCGLSPPDSGSPPDPGGRLTAGEVRACLDEWPGDEAGLVFRTTKESSDTFVGVLMMDLDQSPSLPATVGIAVYDDPGLLDAYEERARQVPEESVARIHNAVVSYHGTFTGRLAQGRRWVRLCLGGR